MEAESVDAPGGEQRAGGLPQAVVVSGDPSVQQGNLELELVRKSQAFSCVPVETLRLTLDFLYYVGWKHLYLCGAKRKGDPGSLKGKGHSGATTISGGKDLCPYFATRLLLITCGVLLLMEGRECFFWLV